MRPNRFHGENDSLSDLVIVVLEVLLLLGIYYLIMS
jgi:hypothetical protein